MDESNYISVKQRLTLIGEITSGYTLNVSTMTLSVRGTWMTSALRRWNKDDSNKMLKFIEVAVWDGIKCLPRDIEYLFLIKKARQGLSYLHETYKDNSEIQKNILDLITSIDSACHIAELKLSTLVSKETTFIKVIRSGDPSQSQSNRSKSPIDDFDPFMIGITNIEFGTNLTQTELESIRLADPTPLLSPYHLAYESANSSYLGSNSQTPRSPPESIILNRSNSNIIISQPTEFGTNSNLKNSESKRSDFVTSSESETKSDSFRPEVPFCPKMLIKFVPNSESLPKSGKISHCSSVLSLTNHDLKENISTQDIEDPINIIDQNNETSDQINLKTDGPSTPPSSPRNYISDTEFIPNSNILNSTNKNTFPLSFIPIFLPHSAFIFKGKKENPVFHNLSCSPIITELTKSGLINLDID